MRIPLGVSLESNAAGGVANDPKVVNGIIEARSDGQSVVRKRPSLTSAYHQATTAGSAQCLLYARGLRAIIGDKLIRLTGYFDQMNPADKGANITLSNNNLTVTCSNKGGVRGVHDGLYGWVAYFEVTLGTLAGQRIGLGSETASLANEPGNDNNALAYDASDGKFYQNNIVVGTATAAITGDIIGVALYAEAAGIDAKWYKNGVLLATFTILTFGGTGAPYVLLGAKVAGGAMTINYGKTPFSYSVPSVEETSISPTVSGKQYWMISNGEAVTNFFALIHNGVQAWWATGLMYTVTAVTPVTPLAAGAAYLDGYFYLMKWDGKIVNSNYEDPEVWNALNFLYAQSEPGEGKFIGKTGSYIVALKEWSTEPFYNAGNATGSPLAAVPNGVTRIGCASGESAVIVNGNIIWIAQDRSGGRSVYMMAGLEQRKISTDDIDRIVGSNSLDTLYAFYGVAAGHHLYILTLPSGGITIVYDLDTDKWVQWTSLTAGTPVSVSSITRSGTTATVTTSAAHNVSDGDPVTIAGAGQSEYNGIFQASRTSSTVFTIEVTGTPATPATGVITSTPYTESYFGPTAFAEAGGVHLFLGASDGKTYGGSLSTYRDNGLPVNFFIRTARMDGGTLDAKKMPVIKVIAPKASDSLMVRWSDDDSTTFSAYRRADLSLDEPRIRRCGNFRRRSIEVRHVGNTAPRLQAIELEIAK